MTKTARPALLLLGPVLALTLGLTACSGDTTRGTPGGPEKSETAASGQPSPYASSPSSASVPGVTADAVLTATDVMTELGSDGVADAAAEEQTADCLTDGCTARVATSALTVTSYPDDAAAAASSDAAGGDVVKNIVLTYGAGADRAKIKAAVEDLLGVSTPTATAT